jgi:hypothetical protein
MRFKDFEEVLSKTGTSADAAAMYKYAEQERAMDRDVRGARRQAGGGGGGGFGGNSNGAVDPMKAMNDILAAMMSGAGGSNGGTGANTPGGSGAGSTSGDVEITPELIEQLKAHMAAQGKGSEANGSASEN